MWGQAWVVLLQHYLQDVKWQMGAWKELGACGLRMGEDRAWEGARLLQCPMAAARDGAWVGVQSRGLEAGVGVRLAGAVGLRWGEVGSHVVGVDPGGRVVAVAGAIGRPCECPAIAAGPSSRTGSNAAATVNPAVTKPVKACAVRKLFKLSLKLVRPSSSDDACIADLISGDVLSDGLAWISEAMTGHRFPFATPWGQSLVRCHAVHAGMEILNDTDLDPTQTVCHSAECALLNNRLLAAAEFLTPNLRQKQQSQTTFEM